MATLEFNVHKCAEGSLDRYSKLADIFDPLTHVGRLFDRTRFSAGLNEGWREIGSCDDANQHVDNKLQHAFEKARKSRDTTTQIATKRNSNHILPRRCSVLTACPHPATSRKQALF